MENIFTSDNIITFIFIILIGLLFFRRKYALKIVSTEKELNSTYHELIKEMYLNRLTDTFRPKMNEMIGIADLYQYEVKKDGSLPNYNTLKKTGNTLTGLGILGTFVGLSWALLNFDFDKTITTEAISPLLAGMRTAFFTSVAGMIASLIYNYKFNAHISKLETQFDEICKEYDSQNIISPTFYIKEQTEYIRKQTEALQNLGKSTGETIAGGLTGIISEHLENLIANLDEKMTDLIDNIQTLLEETLSESLAKSATMLENASDKIQNSSELFDSSTRKLNDVVLNTNSLVDTIEETISGFDKTFKSLDNAIGKIESSINELGDCANQLQGLAGSLNDTEKYVKELNVATDALGMVMEDLKEKLHDQKDMYNNLQTLFKDTIQPEISTFRDSIKDFSETAPNAEKLFNHINMGINDYSEKLGKESAKLLDTYTNKFTEACQSIDNTLQGMKEANESLQTSIQTQRDSINSSHASYMKNIKESAEKLQELVIAIKKL